MSPPAPLDFIEQQHKAGKPLFVWVNFTHMHFRTHVKPESLGQSGRWQANMHDAMIDHDKNVGTVLEEARRTRASPTTPSSCTRPTTART
jgi:hypothetical protein